jgi:hypothetical protein
MDPFEALEAHYPEIIACMGVNRILGLRSAVMAGHFDHRWAAA